MMIPDKCFDRFKGPEKESPTLFANFHPVTDYYGNTIYEEDGVFELTFEGLEFDQELMTAEMYEHSETVTQANIVDLIEEFSAEDLKHIEFIGFGKEYLEMESAK